MPLTRVRAMKVGFVGAGNMATGIARGWAAAAGEPGAPEAMLFADADAAKARSLAEEVGGEALEGNREVADAADLVLVAVKPNVLEDVAGDLKEAGKPVLSILAATTLERLQEALSGLEVVRVMPNLGAQLREAVLCVVYPEEMTDSRRQELDELLGLLGEVIEIDEGLIEAATAVMGSSPGYLALVAEAMVEAGVAEGLTEEQATTMIARAMSATGGLLHHRSPAELKQAVASPGGMTEAGLDALEERAVRDAFKAAVDASLERSARMSG
jgi:pyrroline-5-carboxylate reductase